MEVPRRRRRRASSKSRAFCCEHEGRGRMPDPELSNVFTNEVTQSTLALLPEPAPNMGH
jgi:hypothetical protein